jgi:sugar/nucleoside kinase (ribokinase family)
MTALRLGRRVGVVTSAAAGLDLATELPGVALHVVPARETTRFRNEYVTTGRRQTLLGRAELLAWRDVPTEWRGAAIVHLAPIAREVDLGLAEALGSSRAFIGATAQGWLRGWNAHGDVHLASCHTLAERLRWVDALVVSEEDLGGSEWGGSVLTEAGAVVAVTRGAQGVTISRRHRHGTGQLDVEGLPACPAEVRDATGAGDVFAAAWFVRLASGTPLVEAARYAEGAAACAVERSGVAGVPTVREIEERLERWAR